MDLTNSAARTGSKERVDSSGSAEVMDLTNSSTRTGQKKRVNSSGTTELIDLTNSSARTGPKERVDSLGSTELMDLTDNADTKACNPLMYASGFTEDAESRLSIDHSDPAAIIRFMDSVPIRRFCRISPELRTVLFVAIVINLELTAYSPVETLQSSLNSKAGLGTVSLACVYGPYIIFASVAPFIVRILTPKWTIFTAWACDCLYMGANFYPTWLTLVPTSVLIGAIAGPFWTAKDLYISQMAKKRAKMKTKEEKDFQKLYQSTLIFYNGIVFAGIALAQVLGQLITSVVLTQSSRETPKELNCGAFHCSSRMPTLLNVTNSTTEITNKPEKTLVYTLLGILFSLVILTMFLTAFCIRQIPFTHSEMSAKSTLLSCVVRLTDIKILLMIPQMLLFGFSQAMLRSDYTRSYVTCGKGVGMIGYVMISEGLSGSATSIACGRLVKYTGRRLQAALALCGYAGLYAIMWLWSPTSDVNLALYLVIPFLYGISDVIIQNHICTSLAVLFQNDLPAALANFYTFRALSKSLSFGLSGFVCVWIKLSIVSAIFVFAVVSFVILEALITRVKFEKPNEELAVNVIQTNEDEAFE